MVWPLPSTSASERAGFECFFAHAGSASIASGRIAGEVDPAVLGVSDLLAHLFSVDQKIGAAA